MEDIIKSLIEDTKQYFGRLDNIIKQKEPIQYDQINKLVEDISNDKSLVETTSNSNNKTNIFSAIELSDIYGNYSDKFKKITQIIFNDKYLDILERFSSSGIIEMMKRLQQNIKYNLKKLSTSPIGEYDKYDSDIVKNSDQLVKLILTKNDISNDLIFYILKVLYSKSLNTIDLDKHIENLKNKYVVGMYNSRSWNIATTSANFTHCNTSIDITKSVEKCKNTLLSGNYNILPISEFDRLDNILRKINNTDTYVIIRKLMPKNVSYYINNLICNGSNNKIPQDDALNIPLIDKLTTIKSHDSQVTDMAIVCGKCKQTITEKMCCIYEDLYIIETFDNDQFRLAMSFQDSLGGTTSSVKNRPNTIQVAEEDIIKMKSSYKVIENMINHIISTRPIIYNDFCIIESPKLIKLIDDYENIKQETLDPKLLQSILLKSYTKHFSSVNVKDLTNQLDNMDTLIPIYRDSFIERLNINSISSSNIEFQVSFIKKIYNVVWKISQETKAYMLKNPIGKNKNEYIKDLLTHIFEELDINKSSMFQSFEKSLKEYVLLNL